jgi:hypothetical protein
MTENGGRRLVAVYESEAAARAAVDAALQAGARSDAVRLDDAPDRIVSVRGAMHAQMEHSVPGSGNVGPFTKETTNGILVWLVAAAIGGAVFAVPFAILTFGGWTVWLRVILLVLVGAVVAVGGTVGWLVGGEFGARQHDEPLAAERGVTVTAPALEPVQTALMAASPIRLDLVDSLDILREARRD